MSLVSAELLKLRTTRLLLWLGLLIVALEVLVISLHVSKDSLASLAGPHHQRDIVGSASVSALISLILGIVAVAAAIAGAVLALGSCAFAWGLTALLLRSRSVPVHLGSGRSLRLVLGITLAAAFTGAFGIGFGSLLRRQSAAIVVALVWLLVGEPLLGVAGVERYGPGHVVASIVEAAAGDQGSDVLAFAPGLAVALLYIAVAGGAGAVVLRRTDIT